MIFLYKLIYPNTDKYLFSMRKPNFTPFHSNVLRFSESIQIGSGSVFDMIWIRLDGWMN